MKDNRTQDLQAAADTADAEKEESLAATELGKFRDVQALLEAYRALEAEFTRRSQRLKELEANKEEQAPVSAENAVNVADPSPQAEEERPLSDEVKKAVIAEYLNGVRANKGVPLVLGGGAVTAARRTPSTLKEAGALAKNFFDNKEDR